MKRIIAALMAGSLLIVAFAPAATASHVVGQDISARTGQACVGGTKINIPDDFVNGTTYNLNGGGTVTLWITDFGAGEVLEFLTDDGHLISSIIIKGGPVALPALLYNYVPAVHWDDNVHSRLNLNSGKWYGVSFVCFQSEKKD